MRNSMKLLALMLVLMMMFPVVAQANTAVDVVYIIVSTIAVLYESMEDFYAFADGNLSQWRLQSNLKGYIESMESIMMDAIFLEPDQNMDDQFILDLVFLISNYYLAYSLVDNALEEDNLELVGVGTQVIEFNNAHMEKMMDKGDF